MAGPGVMGVKHRLGTCGSDPVGVRRSPGWGRGNPSFNDVVNCSISPSWTKAQNSPDAVLSLHF